MKLDTADGDADGDCMAQHAALHEDLKKKVSDFSSKKSSLGEHHPDTKAAASKMSDAASRLRKQAQVVHDHVQNMSGGPVYFDRGGAETEDEMLAGGGNPNHDEKGRFASSPSAGALKSLKDAGFKHHSSNEDSDTFLHSGGDYVVRMYKNGSAETMGPHDAGYTDHASHAAAISEAAATTKHYKTQTYRKMTPAESAASAKKGTMTPMTPEEHKTLAAWYAEHGHHAEANAHMGAARYGTNVPPSGFLSEPRKSAKGDAFHPKAHNDPHITVAELNEATDAKAAGKTLTSRQKFVIGEHDALQPKKHRYDREIPVAEVLLKLAGSLTPDDDQIALELAKASGKVNKDGTFAGGFDGCVVHMKGQGYSTDSAKKICGKINAMKNG